jgi:hypothetical protein
VVGSKRRWKTILFYGASRDRRVCKETPGAWESSRIAKTARLPASQGSAFQIVSRNNPGLLFAWELWAAPFELDF